MPGRLSPLAAPFGAGADSARTLDSMEPRSPAVEVRPSDVHGRGVFATRLITPGERFETNPVFRVAADERPHLDETSLHDHYFEFAGDAYIALGAISLLNHDEDPNAEFELDAPALEITLIAQRTIGVGEEVTIHYGVEPWW